MKTTSVLCLAAVAFTKVLSTPSGEWVFGSNPDTTWYSSTEFEFTIDTANKLAGLAKLVNAGTSFSAATITLTQDVDLSEHYWEPIGSYKAKPFEGTFDGGSKLISGVEVNDELAYSGLFGHTKGTVKNVRVNGNITTTSSDSCAGGVVGYCRSCTIKGCINEAKVSGKNFVGGICGCSYYGSILNCQNKGKASGEYVGGICGGRVEDEYAGSITNIKNCFNTGKVTATSTAGGIVGKSKPEFFSITNCYNLGSVTGVSYSCGILGISECIYSGISTIYNCYNNGEASDDEITKGPTSCQFYVDYSYGRSGKDVGYKSGYAHRGTFSSTGELTPLNGNSIINKCGNIVDALNAYVEQEKDNDPTLLGWMKGSDGVPAVFEKKVNVNFNPNGGSISTSLREVALFSTYGELPTPTKDGFEFDNWYTAQDGGTVITETTEVTIDSDHTLYAHWLKKLTVTLDATGGTVSPSSIIVVETKQYTGLVDASKSGYFFGGWYTAPEAGGEQITSTSTVTKNDDHTLYAYWSKAVKVTFDSLGGIAPYDTKEVGVGMKYGPLPTPTLTGYYFDGWFTKLVDGTLVTSSVTVTIDYDHTLYAKWIKGFTVKFDANGGTVSQTEKKYKDTESVYGELPNPTKGVSVFLGWYTEKDGGSLISATTQITPKDDHTLYAHWLNKISVSFDANGGTVSVPSKVYDEGSTYDELPEPEMKDKKFLGWFTKKTDGSKVSENDKVGSSDHTLYAHWGEMTYTITYNTNGGSLIVPTEYEKGSPITLPDKITKKGYIFEGWYLDSNFMEPFTLSEMPGKNIVLYAKWEKEDNSNKNEIIIGVVVPLAVAIIGLIGAIIPIKKKDVLLPKKRKR